MTSKHAPIPRQRSRLWLTGASVGEVDSLQNALDAFKVPADASIHQLRLRSSRSQSMCPWLLCNYRLRNGD